MNVPEQDDSPYGLWVDAWRRAVTSSPGVVGIGDLSTRAVIALSVGAADLLDTTPGTAAGRDSIEFADRPEVASETLRWFVDGAVNGLLARRVFTPRDGDPVSLASWVWAVRSNCERDLGLWVLDDGSASVEAADAYGTSCLEEVPADDDRFGVMILDAGWNVARTTIDQHDQWSPPAVGDPFLTLVRPEDVVSVLVAFARASAGERAALHARPREGGAELTLVVGATAEAPPVFAVAVYPREKPALVLRGERLEMHLRRIAAELEAAGVLAGVDVDVVNVPPLSELSERQTEVMRRLLRGERVPAIAAAMFVSQSTIRNHLSAIFRKVGVHSQSELIDFLRGIRTQSRGSSGPSIDPPPV